MKRQIFSLILCCLVAVSSLWAQTVAFVPYVEALLFRHRANFQEIPEMQKPSTAEPFRSTSGEIGFSAGIDFSTPLFRLLRLSLSAGYTNWNSVLEANEVIPAVRVGDSTGAALFQHRVQLQLQSIRFAQLLQWKAPVLSAGIGTQIDWFLHHSYVYTERILSPQQLEFVEGGRERIRNQGNIPRFNSLVFSMLGQLNVPISIAPSFSVELYARYQRSLTPFLSDSNWHIESFGIGCLFKTHVVPPRKRPVFRDTIYYRDTVIAYDPNRLRDTLVLLKTRSEQREQQIGEELFSVTVVFETYQHIYPVPRPLLTGQVSPRVVFPDGTEDTVSVVPVSPGIRITFHPDVPYLVLPAESDVLDFDFLCPSAGALQSIPDGWEMSPHLQRFLQDIPSQDTLILWVLAPEGSFQTTVQQQAGELQKMLQQCYDFSVQLHVPRQLPATAQQKLREQKRSVYLFQIDSRSPSIQQRQDTIFLFPFTAVRFYISAVAEAGIQQWRILLRLKDTVYAFEGTGTPPAFVDWNMREFPVPYMEGLTTIHYRLEILDADGKVFRTPEGTFRLIIPLQQPRTPSFSHYRFLFSPELSTLPLFDTVRAQLFQLIQQRSGMKSIVFVLPGRRIRANESPFVFVPFSFGGYYPSALEEPTVMRRIFPPAMILLTEAQSK